MIVAIEGLIPDRPAVPAQNKSTPPSVNAQIYQAAWLVKEQRETANPQPGPAPAQAEDAPPPPGPVFDPSESAFANRFQALGETPSALYAPEFVAPDTRVPFSIEKNPSTWRLRL